MIRIRESFSAKLLSALLGTVGLLLIVTFVVVRSVTERQVDVVATRTVQTAGQLFALRNDVRQQAIAVLGRPFIASTRAIQRVRGALADNDFQYLLGDLVYEMALQEQRDALFVLTDETGLPVLTAVGEADSREGDPIAARSLAEAVLFGDSVEISGFRVVDGTMYGVQASYLEYRRAPIGAAVIGLPIRAEEIREIAEVGDFEGCLAYQRSCVIKSAGVDVALEEVMISSLAREEPLRVTVAGMEWSIRAEPLVPSRPDEGHYVVAVPLDAVIAPFASILRALLLGGAAALALSILLGTAISRSLTRPVRALVEASGRVAAGDYHTEVQVDSEDEMGTLAAAFNDMTQGLLVREQYRSVLSKVVSQDIAEELMKGEVELGGENREMTVLFADIRGFTALSEGMEPQDVICLLNECMEHLASAVDAEGGVVDKFIGDEVMAVFGTPVTQNDHALSALRAAARMREGVEEMNDVRRGRGEAPLGLGIGIATGLAVAGNMGSRDRMNYTVLGSTVNLAARLTSEASAGQIVISSATREAVGDGCIASSLGGRDLKGFSSAVEVFSVDHVVRPEGVAARSAGSGVMTAAFLALGSLSFVSAAPAQAQWPTLADAGIGYLSETGSVQIDLSGKLDLETFYFSNDEKGLSGLAVGSDFLFAPRVRLFLDTFLGDHVYGLVEWRGDRGEAPTADFWEARIEQAYLRVSNGSGSLSLQGGIFASPFGSYTNRHLSVVDPFIRPPLPYDYRTVISRRWAPRDERAFSRWKDNPDEWRTDGAPPVWAVPYQWGGMGTIALGRFTFRLAAMNTPPSSEPLDWYEFEVIEDKFSWVAGTSVKITPELQLGASYNNGPYIPNDISNGPPAPTVESTYDQEVWSVDAAFARGPVMLRGEFIHDSWDVPNINETALDLGYTFEAQVDVATGWSLAARYGRIDFAELAGPDPLEWDYDVERWEGAVGYRITRNAGIMATYSTTANSGDVEPRNGLTGIRLWWGF